MDRPSQQMELKIGERVFKIQKLTPETGTYWAFKLFGSLSGTIKGKNPLDAASEFFQKLTPEEFNSLQRACLNRVTTRYADGPTAVMYTDGTLAVTDLNNADLLKLMVTAFAFSLRDFFQADYISGFLESVGAALGLTQANISESTNSSLPPSDMVIGDSASSGTAPTL